MTDYFTVIFYSLVGGLFSLIGGMLLVGNNKVAAKLAKYATAFAAGALLGVAFFDLLPESFEIVAEGAAPRWVLAGFLMFFFLEHSLHWFHHHKKEEHEHVKSAAPLIIIGDTVHNFIDGLAIGTAFLINPATGIVTAVAVAAHEIPQEIGDFGLLLKAGFAPKKVVLINIISSLSTVVGALLTFWLGSRVQLPLGELLAITAGMFIYIAASDLIPDIHDEAKGKFAHSAALLLVLGVLVVGVATEIAHEKIHSAEQEGTESSQHHDTEEHEH
jgi:zinc and cadmium transporter